MAASRTARLWRSNRSASKPKRAGAGLALGAMAIVGVSCGGVAESNSAPGASFQAPSARAAPASLDACDGNPLLDGCPIRESCEENPLLAGCSEPPQGASSPATMPPPPAPAFDAPGLAPIERAEIVLSTRCGSCHGRANPLTCGVCDGLYDIDDIGKLINTGKIVPCRWTDSRIYQRIARDEMPPRYGLPVAPPTAEELQVLGDFVDGMCAELTNGGPADTDRVAIESWLSRDCGSCHGNTAAGEASGAPAGLDGKDDIAELIAAELIVPCSPEGSVLVQRLRDNSMPPPGSNAPRPSAAELRALVAFVDRPCSRR